MKVIDLQEAKSFVRKDGVRMTEFFISECDDEKVAMGHAVFPAGVSVPWAAHDCDEYSFILKGNVFCETKEDGVIHMEAGQSSFIPAGQMHCSGNDSSSDAEVLWILVKKNN